MTTPTERRLGAELRAYRELAADLADRLQVAQQENEAAYRAAFDAHSGPHFCRDLPFGTPRQEKTLAERLEEMAAKETDPARRQAWRMLRRTDAEEAL